MVFTRALDPADDRRLEEEASASTQGVGARLWEAVAGAISGSGVRGTGSRRMDVTIASQTSLYVVWGVGSGNSLSRHAVRGTKAAILGTCSAVTSCSSHGTCNGTRCDCIAAYTGPSCDQCAPGFNSDGASPPTCTAAVLTMKLRLKPASVAMGSPGDATRAKFEADFAADVATTVGISPARVRVKSVNTVTGNVEFHIVSAAEAGVPADDRTTNDESLTLVDIAAQLQAAVASSSSALYSGETTQHTDSSFTPTVRVPK